MKPHLLKLLSLASSPLASRYEACPLLTEFLHGDELSEFLSIRNGFYAFEQALHVLPSSTSVHCMELSHWNDPDTWHSQYGDIVEGHVFFAEDIFGEQFSVSSNGIFRFNPEIGSFEFVASDLEHWAQRILTDHRTETGWPLAHEWQVAHGPLAPGQRLVPATPFFMGGEYTIKNLLALDAVTGMRLRADIYQQTKDLPDGTQITLLPQATPLQQRE